MANGKSSGGKSFFLILITVILAIFFGILAMLLLSPGLEIFGIKYLKQSKQDCVKYFNDDPRQTLNFANYSKIVIDVENCRVEINKGTSTTVSCVNFNLNSQGFYKAGTEILAYDYSVVPDGTTLNIKMLDPNYSFLRLSDVSTVEINICDDMSNHSLDFEIKTVSGNITVGGACDASGTPKEIAIENLTINSKKGSVNVTKHATISKELNITSEEGNITLAKDTNADTVNIQSNKGKITTKSFTNENADIQIQGEEGGIVVENIAGTVTNFTLKAGYFYADDIAKDFSAPNDNLETTIIKINKVGGKFEAVNSEKGNFNIEIKSCEGEVDIIGAKAKINLENVVKGCYIETTSGTITLVVNENNNGKIYVKTDSATINATYNAVKGAGSDKATATNYFESNTGAINLNCKTVNSFKAYLDTQGTIKYPDSVTKNADMTDENAYISGSDTNENILNAYSTKGNITLKLVY